MIESTKNIKAIKNFSKLPSRKIKLSKNFRVVNWGKFIDVRISELLTRKGLRHQNTPG